MCSVLCNQGLIVMPVNGVSYVVFVGGVHMPEIGCAGATHLISLLKPRCSASEAFFARCTKTAISGW